MADGTAVPIDADDRRILRALLSDGRASHRDIAGTTGLSLATVNRRLRRMEKAKVIRGYAPLIDAQAAGWNMNAIIGLRIDKGHIRPVQQSISKDPRIYGVYDVTGEWDGIVLARVRDRADLDDLAKTTLSIQHIQRTNTMVVLATVNETSVVGLPTEERTTRR